MKVKELIEVLQKVDENMEIIGTIGGSRFLRVAFAELIKEEWKIDKDTFSVMKIENISFENGVLCLELYNPAYPYHEYLERMSNLIKEKCC